MSGKKSSRKGNQNSFYKQARAIFNPKITLFSLHVWNKGIPTLHKNSELEITFLSFSLRLKRISEPATTIAYTTFL